MRSCKFRIAGGGGGVVPCAMVVIGPNGVEIKHLQQDFVTSTANAHSQLASNLGNQHRTEKTQAKTTTTAAPASTPVTADQPAASTTTELTTVSG